MRKTLTLTLTLLALSFGARAQDAQTPPAARDTAELTRLLDEFMDGASRNDAAVHERFWADDLVYTGSSGRRVGKADIMRDVRAAPPPKPDAPRTTYTAEDVRIRLYGDAAVVAFRLVGTTTRGGKTEVARFLNTGTFVRRGGRWQAVGWQATRTARDAEEAKREVTELEAAFRRAALASDARALEELTDEGFVWTRGDRGPATRAQMLEAAKAGLLRFLNRETRSLVVDVHGDAAVVRGVVEGPRAGGVGGPAPDAFYTMTFVNRGAGWKAVALHASQF